MRWRELEKLQLDESDLPCLIMFEEHWHQGVIGIVAGRLKDQYHRPAIILLPMKMLSILKVRPVQ